jgi:predicted O-methyltransferase YrrM
MLTSALALSVASTGAASFAQRGPIPPPASDAAPGRASSPAAQFGFNVQKSERLLIREAWERADAWRPGKANWFTQQQKDLVELHKTLLPEFDAQPKQEPFGIPGCGDEMSLLGALLKSLTTGDLALTLCSKEPPVLTELRDWLITALTMEEAVVGLPEEQGRVLSTIARATDARKMLDLGTFTGYSSIAMALATADDARVICCEPAADYARHARDWWLKAGCASKMEMHECRAEELMQKMLDNGEAGTVDMIFCDVGERERYGACHELAMQLLHTGGVVVYYDTLWPADGVLQHSYYPQMRAFNKQLARDPRVLASLVPLSYGITVTMKVIDLDGPALASARAASESGDDGEMLEVLRARRAAAVAELEGLPA